MEGPKTITFAAHLLFCAKNIERATGKTISDERLGHDAFRDKAA
jgi:hypothetical protein